MKKVGFIGGTDKSNIILCVAKVLTYLDNKVLIVDTTIQQRFKYIAPEISPTKSYVTYFEDIDFAVGFNNMLDILRYLGIKDENKIEENIPYDYVLIDIDSSKGIEDFEMQSSESNFFVTTFDMYSLKRGIEILNEIPEPMNLTKVLCNYNIREEDEDFLNYLALGSRIIWNDLVVYVPINAYDSEALDENQKLQRVKIKRLSADYQDGICYIVDDIVKQRNINNIRKSIKE